MPDLQAIFFDIDDTLYSTSEFARRAREASVRAMIEAGLEARPEEVQAELDEVVKEFTSNYEHHFDQLLKRLPRRCLKGTNAAIVVAAGIVAYHRTKAQELAPYPDAVRLLERLARSKLVVGVITDGLSVKQAEKLIRLDVLRFLSPHAIYISDQVGINKPNPKLYLRPCADLNLKPANVLYVGDNPRNDIDPPNRLGMITVRFRRGGKYAAEESETKPRYELRTFDELAEVLVRDLGVDLDAGEKGSVAPRPAETATSAAKG